MTWSRAELKERAKTAFKRNYWKCVLVAFILGLITSNGGSSVSSNITEATEKISDYNDNRNSLYDYDYNDYNYYYNYNDTDYHDAEYHSADYHNVNYHDALYAGDDYYSSDYSSDYMMESAIEAAILPIVVIILLVVALAGFALSILVFNPLQVGGCAFFLENAWINSAGPGLLLQAFKKNYKTTILTMFLRNLYTGLWSLLFIIPGIIKAYEYRMIPYLLAEHPEMSRQDAFYESKRMMNGYKWEAFVLDLSFIGWNFLSILTIGILGIFYVNPYIHATDAELYLALKRDTNQSAY